MGNGPLQSISRSAWAVKTKRPNLLKVCVGSPVAEDGLYQFGPPSTFSACKAAALGDALDPSASGTGRIVMKLHVNWGHVSARQLKRDLADADGDTR